MFVRIHAALGLCISVIAFWLYFSHLLMDVFVYQRADFDDLEWMARMFAQMGHTVTPLAVSAILFMGCEIYARREG